jgi:hypothetical protein
VIDSGLPLLGELQAPDEAVLLIQVVGNVPSALQKTRRAGLPMAIAIGAAVAGAPLIPLYSPSNRPDHIRARLIAVRGGTRELVLLEDVQVGGIPTDPEVGRALAEQIASSVPSAWFAQSAAAPGP